MEHELAGTTVAASSSTSAAWATQLIDDTVEELFEMLGAGEVI